MRVTLRESLVDLASMLTRGQWLTIATVVLVAVSLMILAQVLGFENACDPDNFRLRQDYIDHCLERPTGRD